MGKMDAFVEVDGGVDGIGKIIDSNLKNFNVPSVKNPEA